MEQRRSRLEGRIKDATLAVLPQGLGVDVRARTDSGPATFDIAVRAGTTDHRFAGGWAGSGWPNDVQTLIQAVPDIDVVYARRLSDGSRAWLEDRHLGWVDEARQSKVVLPSGLVVVRESRVEATAPSNSDRWTKTMLAAVEAIFAGVPPTVEAVEVAIGMSRGASANALARLERRGLLERPPTRRGPNASRRVVDPDALLDVYSGVASEFRSRQEVLRFHRLWADPLHVLGSEIGPGLAATGAKWAVTGAAASTLMAPYLSDLTVIDLYVDHSLLVSHDLLTSVLGGRMVDKGHRIEVRELPTPMSANGPEIDAVQVALPARVYADLVAAGGRAEEAAHHLREVRGVGSQS